MNEIIYKEILIAELTEYDKIPFGYTANKEYKLKKLNNGLGGILLELTAVSEYTKEFGAKSSRWMEMFDLTNWRFYVALDGMNYIGDVLLLLKQTIAIF